MANRFSTLAALIGIIAASLHIAATQNSSTNKPGLVFSTFLGGQKTKTSYGAAIALDKNGGLLVTGRTQADDFPNVNSAQKSFGGGENDAFVTKYAIDGQKMLYSSYLGGKDVDFGEDIAADAAGNVYVTGTTYSKDFPATKQAAQQAYGGGDRDCFVAKLSPDGALLYATLLGGEGTDRCAAIAVDNGGNAYVTGSTNSSDWIASKVTGSIGKNKDWDVFVVKLDPTGSRKIYALRFGGTSGKEPSKGGIGGEAGTGIAVDNAGIAYVVGHTDSQDFPIPPLPFGGKGFEGRRIGGFVVTVDAAGSGIKIGGWPGYSFEAIALDPSGGLVVTGTHESFTPNGPGGTSPPFVIKLTGGNGVYGVSSRTYVSGTNRYSGSISASDVAVDGKGNAYFIGGTNSAGLPLVNPLQPQLGGPGRVALIREDAFVARVDLATNETIRFSTYLGGSGQDGGAGIAVDDTGDIYVVGNAGFGGGGNWTDFPTVRALQTERHTISAFVSRISFMR